MVNFFPSQKSGNMINTQTFLNHHIKPKGGEQKAVLITWHELTSYSTICSGQAYDNSSNFTHNRYVSETDVKSCELEGLVFYLNPQQDRTLTFLLFLV